MNTDEIIWVIECVDGLYRMQLGESNIENKALNYVKRKNVQVKAMRWNRKIGHINAERYMDMERQLDEVSLLHRSLLEKFE